MVDINDSTVVPTARRPGVDGQGHRPQALPCLTILGHPDPERIGDRAVLGELVAGHSCELARHRPDFLTPGGFVGRPLGDRHLSRKPILIESDGDGWRLDASSTSTPVRVDGDAAPGVVELGRDGIERGLVLVLSERVVLLLHLHTPPSEPDAAVAGLLGESDSMVEVRREIRRVAHLHVGVLLRGETGSGKEVVARALHALSPRSAGPFVAVNLGALPPSLATAELFGAERGAYTGAGAARDGCFGRASGGTLFLDEVGEAPAEVQVAMLRALETGEIWPLGASRPRRVELRTVAATDADLEARIADGSFKEPLLHRLAGYEILLPPLRLRRDDLGRLLLHFCREQARQLGTELQITDDAPWIDARLVARLAGHAWPGNVRQLRNVASQLVIGNQGRSPITAVPAVDRTLQAPTPTPTSTPGRAVGAPFDGAAGPERATQTPAASPKKRSRKPADIDDEEILETLRREHFEVKAAADLLGISRAALYVWIQQSPRVRTVGQIDADEVRTVHEELGGDLEAVARRLEVSRFSLRRRLRELGL